MTRFARAKGSKASNERVPEESTPWSQMKKQLLEKNREIEDSKTRQDIFNQRNANYKAFLEEKEAEESKKSQWAEFPVGNTKKESVKKNKNPFSLKTDLSMSNDLSDDETFNALKAKVDKVLSQPEHNRGNNQEQEDSDAPPEEHSSKIEVMTQPIKIKKTKKKKLSITIDENAPKNKEQEKVSKKRKNNEKSPEKYKKIKKSPEALEEANSPDKVKDKMKKIKKAKGTNQPKEIAKENLTEKDLKTIEKKKQRRIKQLEKKKRAKEEQKKLKEEEKSSENVETKKIVKENLTEKDFKKIEKKKQKQIKQLEKKKRAKEEQKKLKEEEEKNTENVENTESPNKQVNGKITHNQKFNKTEGSNNFKGNFEKPNKFINKKFDRKPKDNKDHQRKKPLLPSKMIINGKEVEIDYVDGFPVKKEDAARLKKLKKEMISKGLPRSEINIAMKLERRKAEKAFAREKKKVCFNCRKSGHNLSECPELDKDQVSQSGTGICFKCGSTEHTHFECKVVRGQDFKYASCFICNEQGHIARQCPDNARGLYPKGGACKVCGDVTHLKKDCPKYQAQQQQLQSNLNIETIGSSNPDILDDNRNINVSIGTKRPNKIIKF